MQRAKQSAKYKFDFSLILAECPIITEFSTKKKIALLRTSQRLAMTTAYTWQIASLVALARNDSRLF